MINQNLLNKLVIFNLNLKQNYSVLYLYEYTQFNANFILNLKSIKQVLVQFII